MRQMSFAAIEKRLAKKNSELQEVRAMRKRLAEREKELSAEIENLQNQKVEVVFLQVKKEMKNEKLDVSSETRAQYRPERDIILQCWTITN